MGGFLCVNYASFCAARSAVVIVPAELEDEPANTLQANTSEAPSDKLDRIHRAAVWAVLPVGAGRSLPGQSDSPYSRHLQDGLEAFYARYDTSPPNWVRRRLGHKLAYAERHTRVTIDPPTDGSEVYGEHQDLTVRVEHDLYLAVPYAGRVLAWLDSDHAVDLGDGRYALSVSIPCTLPNAGASDRIREEQFPDED
jgi:hypothetical protein